MDISCVNCGLEFAFDDPGNAGQVVKARCPRCGHNNEVMAEGGAAPGGGGDQPWDAVGGDAGGSPFGGPAGGADAPGGAGDSPFGTGGGSDSLFGAGGQGGDAPGSDALGGSPAALGGGLGGDPTTAAGGVPAIPDAPAAATGDEVFCFNCGKPMQANSSELIPVCDECKAGGSAAAAPPQAPVPGASFDPDHGAPSQDDAGTAAGGAELMIRKSNGQVYGPFPKETVVEWIQAGKIQADEEVSKVGGAWRLFSGHEEFASYFPDSVKKKSRPARGEELQFKKINPAAETARSAIKIGGVAVFLVAIVAGVYFLASSGTLRLPDEVLDSATDAISGDGQAAEDDVPVEGRTGEMLDEIVALRGGGEESSFEHYYRARTLMSRGNPRDLQEAVVEMETAVALDTRNAAALAGLGELYNKLALTDEASGELQRRSFYFIDYALEQGDYRLEANRAKAWFLYVAGKYDEALGFCNQALSISQDDPETHLLMGMCHFARNHTLEGEALTHFNKALELDPDYSDVFFEKGLCFEELGQYTRAIEMYQAKNEAAPEFIGAHYRMGALYEEVGDYARAIESFEHVLTMDRLHKDAILRLGRLLTQFSGDPGRAVALYRRLGEEGAPVLGRGEKVELALGQSAALRATGDPAGACAGLPVAEEIAPTNVAVHFERAMCEHARGDTDASLVAFGKTDTYATDLTPRESAMLKYFQGLVYLDEERWADAFGAFDQALNAAPSFVPATVAKAGAYAKLDQVDQVKASLQQLRAIDPLYYRETVEIQRIWSPIPSMGPTCQEVSKDLVGVNFDPELYGLVGAVCYHAGESSRAGSYLAQSLEDDPGQWSGLLYTALAAADRGDLGKASRLADTLTSEHRDIGAFYLVKGQFAQADGHPDEAMDNPRTTPRSDRDLVRARMLLGGIYLDREQRSEAKQELVAATKTDRAILQPRLMLFESGLL